MKRRSAIAVAGTILIAAAAWYISHLRAPETNVGTPPLYPKLSERVNDVERVEIKSHDKETVLTGDGNAWKIESRDGYPARFADVKRTILALANLKIIEPKTKRPQMYTHIGVEDVEAKNAQSTRITLKDGAGAAIASLIIGKERLGAGGPSRAARYVRKAEEPQSWLVAGDINVSADPASWTDQQLLSIPASRIRAVSIESPGKPAVRIERDKPTDIDLALEDVPEGYKPKAAATVTSIASALEELRFEDVRAKTNVEWPAESTVTTLRSFDGMIATVKSATIDDRQYAQFAFDYDPAAASAAPTEAPAAQPETPEIPQKPEGGDAAAKEEKISVAEEVKALNERVQGWVYVLPDYKRSMLTRTMDDLIAKQEAAKPQQPPPAQPVDPLTVERFDAEGNPLPPLAPGDPAAPGSDAMPLDPSAMPPPPGGVDAAPFDVPAESAPSDVPQESAAPSQPLEPTDGAILDAPLPDDIAAPPAPPSDASGDATPQEASPSDTAPRGTEPLSRSFIPPPWQGEG